MSALLDVRTANRWPHRHCATAPSDSHWVAEISTARQRLTSITRARLQLLMRSEFSYVRSMRIDIIELSTLIFRYYYGIAERWGGGGRGSWMAITTWVWKWARGRVGGRARLAEHPCTVAHDVDNHLVAIEWIEHQSNS